MITQIKIDLNGGCFPNAHQILLLKAALLSGDEAIFAWRQWSEIVNIDRLDWGEVKLLPLLYHNLKQNGIAESQIPGIFKGMYRRTWAENKLRFHHAGNMLSHFVAAGIPTIVLKGAVISSHYYQDYGLRPMTDFDFLVPIDRVKESIELLRQNDWQPIPSIGIDHFKTKEFDQNYTYLSHGRGFTNCQKQEVDLHWHILNSSLAVNADCDFWERARSIEIARIQTLMLDPADQLLHICAHGARWNFVTPIRWVADSMIIIQRYPDLDWERLIKQATKHRLMLPMQATLQFLATHLAAPIPLEVFQALSKIKPTPEEELCYQLATTLPPPRSLGTKIDSVMAQGVNYYRHSQGLAPNAPVSLADRIQDLPNFLQHYLAVDSKWQIPRAGISKIIQHIRP
jgi:hypothetical protein